MPSIHWCLYVHFTDKATFVSARTIIPSTNSPTMEKHTRFVLLVKIRLTVRPVGVGHCRHGLTAWLGWNHSPDERCIAIRMYALSSRPEKHCRRIWRIRIASTQICHWKHSATAGLWRVICCVLINFVGNYIMLYYIDHREVSCTTEMTFEGRSRSSAMTRSINHIQLFVPRLYRFRGIANY